MHVSRNAHRMKNSTKKIIRILMEADETITEEHHTAMVAALEHKDKPAPLLTSREVQHLLKISKSGVRRMIDEGILVPTRLRYLIRFRQQDVEELMEEGFE